MNGATFISAHRACGELGVSMDALRKWRYLGVGPTPVHVTSNHVVYDLEEVLSARENGVHDIAAAIVRKRASLSTQPTLEAARAAVASRAASEARRRRREDVATPGSLTQGTGK